MSVKGMTVRAGGSVDVDAEPSGRTLRVRLCVLYRAWFDQDLELWGAVFGFAAVPLKSLG